MKLILPYPVSSNRYWRSFVPKGWTRALSTTTLDVVAFGDYMTQVEAWAANRGILLGDDAPQVAQRMAA